MRDLSEVANNEREWRSGHNNNGKETADPSNCVPRP
jgi:hypothetical protein